MKSLSVPPTANRRHEDWIPLIELAAREVFERVLGCQLTLPVTAEERTLDITATVGLAGQLCGVLSVRCDRRATALIASKMLGVDMDRVGPDVSDVLGEICNMVAGNFKNKVAGIGDSCVLSLPTITVGSDYNLRPLADADCDSLEVRLLFESLPLVISLHAHSGVASNNVAVKHPAH